MSKGDLSSKNDLVAEQACQMECINAFIKLSRHYCKLNDNDSVAEGQAREARKRTLGWLVAYIQDKSWL